MIRIVTICLLFFIPFCAAGQFVPGGDAPPPPPLDSGVYEFVDEPAQFPGGDEAMKKFIKQNLKIPAIVKELDLEGRCAISFVVDIDGGISSVKAFMPSDCKECDQEAIRMVESMPDWTPGKIGGKSVKSIRKIPVRFTSNN